MRGFEVEERAGGLDVTRGYDGARYEVHRVQAPCAARRGELEDVLGLRPGDAGAVAGLQRDVQRKRAAYDVDLEANPPSLSDARAARGPGSGAQIGRLVGGAPRGGGALAPGQARAVLGLQTRRDVLVLMPTGGGKTEVVAVAALRGAAAAGSTKRRLAVVFEPLVSVRTEQCERVRRAATARARSTPSTTRTRPWRARRSSTTSPRPVGRGARERGDPPPVDLLYLTPGILTVKGTAEPSRFAHELGRGEGTACCRGSASRGPTSASRRFVAASALVLGEVAATVARTKALVFSLAPGDTLKAAHELGRRGVWALYYAGPYAGSRPSSPPPRSPGAAQRRSLCCSAFGGGRLGPGYYVAPARLAAAGLDLVVDDQARVKARDGEREDGSATRARRRTSPAAATGRALATAART
ncbi:hypothetical protein JL722_15259 [Aureococcus anophagefferens]|nr:hypothetical protein JL722_15259 [Aureococcus anophagefferens]